MGEGLGGEGVQFRQRDRAAIEDGSLTMTIRRWKAPQAVAGHRYRTAAGMIEVEAVGVIAGADITDADATASGHPSAVALRAALGGDSSLPLYKVVFHAVAEPDPRDDLAATVALREEERAELRRRLYRLDAATPRGPWTTTVLALIDANSGVRAADLAAQRGRETQPFKLDVRKLKALGLTVSLETGYRLSPRGQAWLGGER